VVWCALWELGRTSRMIAVQPAASYFAIEPSQKYKEREDWRNIDVAAGIARPGDVGVTLLIERVQKRCENGLRGSLPSLLLISLPPPLSAKTSNDTCGEAGDANECV